MRQDGAYRLFCNRDEKHTRRTALPPCVREQCGVRFIAPLDGDYGGSWIGVNQFGLSLCLLNRYQDKAIPPVETASYLSRGLLLVELIDCQTRSQTQSRIEQINLTHFRPFTLLIMEPEQPSLLTHWTGQKRLSKIDGESAMPLISSSHDPTGVSSIRRRFFNSLMTELGGLMTICSIDSITVTFLRLRPTRLACTAMTRAQSVSAKSMLRETE